jgi:F-box-like
MQGAPDELLMAVFGLLKPRDLLRVRWTCALWRRVGYDFSLWRRFCRVITPYEAMCWSGTFWFKHRVERRPASAKKRISEKVFYQASSDLAVCDFIACMIRYGMMTKRSNLFINNELVSKGAGWRLPKAKRIRIDNREIVTIVNSKDRDLPKNLTAVRYLYLPRQLPREFFEQYLCDSPNVVGDDGILWNPDDYDGMESLVEPGGTIEIDNRHGGWDCAYIFNTNFKNRGAVRARLQHMARELEFICESGHVGRIFQKDPQLRDRLGEAVKSLGF